MLEISLSNLFLFNKRCTLGPSRNQLRDIQTPPKSGMLYRSKGLNSIWKWKYFINCVGYWSNEAFKCYCGSFFIFIIIFFYSLRAFAVEERRKLGVNK